MNPGASRPAPRLEAAIGQATVVVFVGNVIARGLGFLFPLVLARVTAREDFALVYFYVNAGFFVGELVLAGYPTALTRYLAAPGSVPRGTWLIAAMAGGLPLLIASFGAAWLFAGNADASPGLLALVVMGLTLDAYYFAVLRGLGRFRLLVAYRIAANLAQIVLLVIASSAGLVVVELAVAVYTLVYLLPIVAIEAWRAPLRSLLTGLSEVRVPIGVLTRFAIPALISGTAYAAIQGLDVYFVRVLVPEGLADYAGARALAMPMSLVPFAVGVVLLPRVAAADPTIRTGLLARALAVVIGVDVLAVLGYMVLGPLVTSIVYPASFAGIPEVLPWLAVAMGATGTYSILSQWWMGIARPIPPAIALTTGAVAAVGAHLAFDQRFGSVGAAWAMGTGATVALALLGMATVLTTQAGPGRGRMAS